MKRFSATVASAVVCGMVAVSAQAGGGKVQICHGTASDTNPYVLVDVSANAASTHLGGHGAQNAPDFVYDASFGSCAAQAAAGRGF